MPFHFSCDLCHQRRFAEKGENIFFVQCLDHFAEVVVIY